MNDEILKKLESKVGRRSFLRGSGLAAAMIVGVAAASPLIGYAQSQDPPKDDKKKSDDKKTDDNKKSDGTSGDDKQTQSDNAGSTSETKLDADGYEYRECPQCGGNMYRQGRTWTCENCGYSYVE
ncbi:MAG TPA: hypothetical protein VHU82_10860 [Vicinamibacterales bacterium]|jgi:rubredoxin|nr:hypothetical protein [Vicinamibacterales bacterium]